MKSEWVFRAGRAILVALAVTCVLAVVRTAASGILLDFTIFHAAGRAMLAGASPYDFYGTPPLPFQYVPWALWLFLPLAALPFNWAWAVFVALNLLMLGAAFVLLVRLHGSRLTRPEVFALYGISLLIGLMLFLVGQVGVLQLMAAVLMMVLVCRDRPVLAGVFFPLLITKPHLVIVAVPALWWVGGRKTVLSSLAATALLAGISLLITPSWIPDMLRVIVAGQLRNDRLVWNFSTLAGALDLERGWNPIIAAALIPVGAAVAFKFRRLPPAAWLSLAFALSLLVAPYAFAYDLLLLLPAMIWLTDRWAFGTLWLWMWALVVVGVSNFSGGSYVLTVTVTAVALWRGRRYLRGQPTTPLALVEHAVDSDGHG
jgi:alpha-1,2-mannosyltransferase